MRKSQRRVGHSIKLVHSKNDGVDTQQVHQQRVPASLHQQLGQGRLPVEFGGVHQHNSCVGARCGGDHVAGVLLVTGGVRNDEFAALGRKVTVGHVNRDALFALRRQAIGQQGQVSLAAALHACQVVLQYGPAVDQQAAYQRALAVINTAAGDKTQGGPGVLFRGHSLVERGRGHQK